jgi:hypothetical protein
MKAVWLILFVFAFGVLTGPTTAHAKQNTIKALLEQGFFYGPLPGTANHIAPDVQRKNDLDEFIGFMSKNSWKSFSLTPMGGIAFATFERDRWHGEDRKLFGDDNNSAFRPVLGFEVAHTILIDNDTTLTPEAHIVYRREMLDGIQAGVSFGFKMGDNLAARLSLDANLQPDNQDHRAVFFLKYRF